MAENRIQHFVPQFLLRNFAVNEDKTHIASFYIKNEKFIAETKISRQAEKKYYYGDDGGVEEALSKIEARSAPIIMKMLEKNEIPMIGSQDHYHLAAFIMTMISRTKYMGDMVLETANKFLKQTMLDSPNDEEFKKPFREDKIRINHDYPVLFSLSKSLQYIILLCDLNYKLLINTTKTPFIISDNPVVLYNQSLEKKREFANNIGFTTPGLQMFMPISPSKGIIFYDENFYNVGSKNNKEVCVKEDKDVENLNMLQCLSANENLYFDSIITEGYIRDLFNKTKKYRRSEKINLQTYVNPEKQAPNNLLYMLTTKEIRMNLTLSFVFETAISRNFQIGSKLLLVRNPELLARAQKTAEEFKDRGI